MLVTYGKSLKVDALTLVLSDVPRVSVSNRYISREALPAGVQLCRELYN